MQALLAQGLDLEAALAAAPQKDGGFSAMTLAWVLEHLPVNLLGRQAGLDETRIQSLLSFKTDLISRLLGTDPPP